MNSRAHAAELCGASDCQPRYTLRRAKVPTRCRPLGGGGVATVTAAKTQPGTDHVFQPRSY